MKSYKVWEETSLNLRPISVGGLKPQHFRRGGFKSSLPIFPVTSDFLLLVLNLLRHRTPLTSSSGSQLSPTLCPCYHFLYLLPLCCRRNCFSVNSSLTIPLCSFSSHSLDQSQSPFITAAYQDPPKKALLVPCWFLGSGGRRLFSSLSTTSSDYILKYLLSVHSCLTQYFRT